MSESSSCEKVVGAIPVVFLVTVRLARDLNPKVTTDLGICVDMLREQLGEIVCSVTEGKKVNLFSKDLITIKK